MKKEKLDQLKIVFDTKIKAIINDVKKGMDINSEYVTNVYAEEMSNQLVHEVKIRINNKKG